MRLLKQAPEELNFSQESHAKEGKAKAWYIKRGLSSGDALSDHLEGQIKSLNSDKQDHTLARTS